MTTKTTRGEIVVAISIVTIIVSQIVFWLPGSSVVTKIYMWGLSLGLGYILTMAYITGMFDTQGDE